MKQFKIDKEPKIKSGFQVPKDYFDTFENKLFNQLNIVEETKVIKLEPRKINWYVALAAIVILAISIPIYQNWKINSISTPTSDELEYYVSNRPNFTSNDIISQLSDDEILSMQLKSELKTENIENYLLETENIEYYLID